MHQSSHVFNLGRVSLTYTGPSQFNHINDNRHIYVGNNPGTRLGPAWTQAHN